MIGGRWEESETPHHVVSLRTGGQMALDSKLMVNEAWTRSEARSLAFGFQRGLMHTNKIFKKKTIQLLRMI